MQTRSQTMSCRVHVVEPKPPVAHEKYLSLYIKWNDQNNENKKLKEELERMKRWIDRPLKDNEKLKEEIAHKNNKFCEWIEENRDLKEENDKLQEENKELWLDNESLGLQDKELQEKIAELQEEIAELKVQVFHNTTKDEIKEIYRVSLNLKEENEKLKENKYDKFKCSKCQGHHTGCSNPTCDSCVKDITKENEKLKEENKGLWLQGYIEGAKSCLVEAEKNDKLQETIKKLNSDLVKCSRFLKDAEKFTEKFKNQFIKEREENEKLLKDYKQLNSDWAKKRDEDGDEYRITINELKEKLNVLETQEEEIKTQEEEIKKLTEESDKHEAIIVQEKRISFWRMCESYNGFQKNTNLCDPDWLEEMKAQIWDRKDEINDEGDLYEGYKEWIGYGWEEEEDSD